MTWKLRHEGSPQSIEGLTLPQIVQGLQKRMDAPDAGTNDPKVPVLSKNVQNQMVLVSVDMENGAPVIRVENNVVDHSKLAAELRAYVKRTSHTDLLFKHGYDVPFGTV